MAEDLLGIPWDSWFRYILLPDDGQVQFAPGLDVISLDDEIDDSAYVSVSAVALMIVAAAPRPLFTLVAPGDFG